MVVYRAFWVVREGRTEGEAMELFKEFPLEGPRRRQV